MDHEKIWQQKLLQILAGRTVEYGPAKLTNHSARSNWEI